MFDFAWSEIALIGVVALVLIGPKDMPVAIKAMTGAIKKARRMAADFQGQVDEMVRDTELADVRRQINEIRNFDIRGEVERTVDADGSLRRSFAEPLLKEPLVPTTAPLVTPPPVEAEFAQAENAVLEAPPPEAAAEPAAEPAPAAPPAGANDDDCMAFLPPSVRSAPEVPEFIPPRLARSRGRQALRF